MHEILAFACPQTTFVATPPVHPFYGICLDAEYPFIADFKNIARTRESRERVPKPLWGRPVNQIRAGD